MRIAYLINQYPKISHSFIRREILALERQGFEVRRISLRGWKEQTIDKEDFVEKNRTHYVLREGPVKLLISLMRMLISRPLSLFKACALTYQMSRRSERGLPIHFIYLAEACHIELWLRANPVQHLHAHFGTNSAEVAMLVHELGGPSWSFTIHGPEEFDRAPLIGLENKICRSAFVVGISSYTRGQIYYRVEHKHWRKIHVVHCGLESNYFEKSSTTPLDKRLVCVGRLCEQKGQMLLIEALHRLNIKGIEFDMVLAGDGPMRQALEELIHRYDLAKKVYITGWISGEMVREQILQAQALVLPSLAEGLPVVIMESMALRRPVISTYIAGIPELVEPPKQGWLVPAGDVQSLAAAIESCLSTPRHILDQMGDAARERVISRHSVESQVARLAELFKAGR